MKVLTVMFSFAMAATLVAAAGLCDHVVHAGTISRHVRDVDAQQQQQQQQQQQKQPQQRSQAQYEERKR